MKTNGELPVADVVMREDLYPRIEKDPALVQRYAEVVELLPPIEVNQHNELIDGWHRWTAHKTRKCETIRVTVTKTASDAEFMALACRRNATAGKQLTERDKSKMAIRLYMGGEGCEKAEIAEVLSVTERQVRTYLQDIDDQLQAEREEKMTAMWLACHTQQEIADAVGLAIGAVNEFLQKISESEALPKAKKSAISHESDFERKVYANWSFPMATNQIRIFGNIPPEIIDNLLYYYTKPFDVVFDPFGGGAVTIDVCRKRWRRYYVSDLTPIEARKHEIRQHDITTGLPDDLPVPDMVFLDPPYWQQAKGKYSDKATDLANMGLEAFLDCIANIAKWIKRKWQGNHKGKLALLIGPWKEDGRYIELPFLCYARIAKYLTPLARIIVPYNTEIHSAAFVKMAQEKREILYINRDLMIFGTHK